MLPPSSCLNTARVGWGGGGARAISVSSPKALVKGGASGRWMVFGAPDELILRILVFSVKMSENEIFN